MKRERTALARATCSIVRAAKQRPLRASLARISSSIFACSAALAPVLRVLNHKHHQKSDDIRPRVHHPGLVLVQHKQSRPARMQKDSPINLVCCSRGPTIPAFYAARVFAEKVARVIDKVVPFGPAKVLTWASS
jgi:hypothetical protein